MQKIVSAKFAAGVSLALLSAAANAELTGNAGVVSEYLFRGVESSNGAAVQGGVDWGHASGFSAGAWGSNTFNGGSGNELDVYGGYNFQLGDFALEAGAIYYYFSEDDENGVPDTSYPEVYVGAALGPIFLRAYYTDDFYGSDGDGTYLMGSYVGSITDTLTISLQAGVSGGNGVDSFYGEAYTDYSISLVKALDDDSSVSFSYVGSDLETGGRVDDPAFVIGFKKAFAIDL